MPPTYEDLQAVTYLLGITWLDAFADLIRDVASDVRLGTPAPLIAARAANAVMNEDRQAEALAWWMADLALSWRMGWRHAVLLLASQIHATVLRVGPDRRRGRPDTDGFERVVCLAAAAGASEACRIAAGIAQQADRLIEVKRWLPG